MTDGLLSFVIDRLQAAKLQPSTIREILLSQNVDKLTRTYANDAQLMKLAPCLDEIGLTFLLSEHKFLVSIDKGKGGFSNAVADILPEDSPVGHFAVYIGHDMAALAEARRLDESGDHDGFGDMLGIPACCRKHFAAHASLAQSEQNDFSGFIRAQDGIDRWSLHYGQYFGYGLVSHFPCSFACPKTAALAKSNWQTLKAIAPAFATTFESYQDAAYLYTEYDGVYAFFSVAPTNDRGGWQYDNKRIEATQQGLLFEILRHGDVIIRGDDGQLRIYAEGRLLTILPDSQIQACFPDQKADLKA